MLKERNKTKMKIAKTILNVILSFLLIFIILSMIVLNLVSTKMLDKNYMLSKLKETEFYLQISREVQSGFEKYIYQSGLPEDIINDLYTEEMITSDVNSIIDYIYEGKEITTSEDKIKETLDTKINQYLQSEGRTKTNQIQDNITKFEDFITTEYKNNIKVSDTVFEKVQKGMEKILSIYQKIKLIPLIAFIIIIILLLIINRKDIFLGINFASISLLSVGVLLKLAEQVVYKHVDLDNIVLLTTSLSNLIINMAKDLLYTIADYGIWLIAGGITGIIICSIIRNTTTKEKKDKKETTEDKAKTKKTKQKQTKKEEQNNKN